jgi:hypothetical protein
MDYPIPISSNTSIKFFLASSSNRIVMDAMERGEMFCFQGSYGTAMAFYSWLKKQVDLIYPITNYESSRVNRERLREFGQRLLVRVNDHQIDLQKAPHIPWLSEFYPDLQEFYLPFTHVLGINGAYQWFIKGIQFPGLKNSVHPYYGVYFPTRTEHLQLFDDWLQRNKPFGSAMDLGTGCGVLSFYMLKHGVQNIVATDINPNAIHSVRIELERLGLLKRVILSYADMFEGIDCSKLDLVVFNPPWIPDRTTSGIDQAMYYPDGFFERFFAQAYEALPKGCRVVILFSTFAQAAGLNVDHPIKMELEAHKRFSLISSEASKLTQKPSRRKHWLTDIRLHEKIELWELRVI